MLLQIQLLRLGIIPTGSFISPLRVLRMLVGMGVAGCLQEAGAQLPTVPFPLPEITISYVSEVPWPADAGAANPLEWWGKKLSTDWAAPITEDNARLSNLRPELSWNHLKKSATSGRANIFVIHGYELLEQGPAARIEALLTPAREGKAATTEFIILRRRDVTDNERFTMAKLEDEDIVVDRGGCGDLVYRWLETEIVPETGKAHRETFAEFHSASSPAEAILSVYFGDAYACVVSRESSKAVFRTNPKGFAAKLEEVRNSPPLLKHIIACRQDMPPAQRKDVIRSASAIRLEHQGNWTLTVPSNSDLKSLTTLIERWQYLLGGKQPEGNDPSAASVATPGTGTGRTARESAGDRSERRTEP
jgi:hypothetical protein